MTWMFKVSNFKFTALERQAMVSCSIWMEALLPGPAFCRCWVLWATRLPAESPAAPRLWGWGAPGWQGGVPRSVPESRCLLEKSLGL